MGKKEDDLKLDEHRKKLAELKKSARETISRVQEAMVRAEQIAAKVKLDQSKLRK